MTIGAIRQSAGTAAMRIILLGLTLFLWSATYATPAAVPDCPAATGALPFAVGERLVYHIEWNPPWYFFLLPSMEAGEVTLNLASETLYQNRRAFNIVFAAHSSGVLSKLTGMTVNDYYEYVTDAETLCTCRVTKREREGKRMRDIDLVYLPDTRELHLREVDVSVPSQRVIRDRNYGGIPPCVKDLFSALYALRRGSLEAGASSRVLVGDNQNVKEVEVRVSKKEQVATPAGSYAAWQVNTIAMMGGLFKQGGQFRLWLSADERKIPVKFEVQVSLGKVTGSLKEAHF